MVKKQNKTFPFSKIAWDLCCIASIVGIWPRYVEPRLLSTRNVRLALPNLPKDLHGSTIVQFSDLHIGSHVSDRFLNKLKTKIDTQKPDLIVFTGDFLCDSQLIEPERLKRFLSSLHAPLGCFATLGNHDYAKPIAINKQGLYDIKEHAGNTSPFLTAFRKLLQGKIPIRKECTKRVQNIDPHQELLSLLKQTPFTLLHNSTQAIPVGNSYLNVSGLGEYTAGKLDSAKAFKGYHPSYPGIVLAHNPDSIPHLESSPGSLILCGHTHGGHINIPGLWKRIAVIENDQFKSGLHKVGNKWAYISKGVGASLPFRCFARPEITSFTLHPENQEAKHAT